MENEKTKAKKPAKPYVDTVREGAIAANIFVAQSPDGNQSHYFVINRCWKNQTTGHFKYTDRMYARNSEAIAAVVARAAERCVTLNQALDQGDDAVADPAK